LSDGEATINHKMSDVGENSGSDSHGEGEASNEEIIDKKGSLIW
jgi:hypothetical protein